MRRKSPLPVGHKVPGAFLQRQLLVRGLVNNDVQARLGINKGASISYSRPEVTLGPRPIIALRVAQYDFPILLFLLHSCVKKTFPSSTVHSNLLPSSELNPHV